jgi:hypothetical protein
MLAGDNMAALRFSLLVAYLAVPALAYAHGGGLDAYGCHHNRKAGGYHCHRGPLAGQVFMSKDAMLKELSKRNAESSKTPRKN